MGTSDAVGPDALDRRAIDANRRQPCTRTLRFPNSRETVSTYYGSGVTTHFYATNLSWDGSTAAGYRAYSRSHRVSAPPAAAELTLSADPHYRGDETLLNPEQLLVMAVSSCQLLSFLALAALRHVNVLSYEDDARGSMADDVSPVRISHIELVPTIQVEAGTDHDLVRALVHEAHETCYIANSLNTTITVEPKVIEDIDLAE